MTLTKNQKIPKLEIVEGFIENGEFEKGYRDGTSYTSDIAVLELYRIVDDSDGNDASLSDDE